MNLSSTFDRSPKGSPENRSGEDQCKDAGTPIACQKCKHCSHKTDRRNDQPEVRVEHRRVHELHQGQTRSRWRKLPKYPALGPSLGSPWTCVQRRQGSANANATRADAAIAGQSKRRSRHEATSVAAMTQANTRVPLASSASLRQGAVLPPKVAIPCARRSRRREARPPLRRNTERDICVGPDPPLHVARHHECRQEPCEQDFLTNAMCENAENGGRKSER